MSHAATNTSLLPTLANSTGFDTNLTSTPLISVVEGHVTDESVLFVRALLLLLLITIAVHVNHFLKVNKFKYIGETAVYILIGYVVACFWTGISYDSQNLAIQMNAELFYLLLLPPIIFEGGYTLSKISFFQNLPLILLLAFIGAFYSTMITSVLMFFFSQLSPHPWTFVESLVFGSLISSTDPVTVLSLLPSNVDRRLYMLIFGESALNDAVAIILFRFFTSIKDTNLTVESFFMSALVSCLVFVGSFLVGISLGMIYALLTKNVHVHHDEVNVYQVSMLLVFAYSSYLLAEALSLTGIISVFFCGIAMAHYAHPNLSPTAAKSWKVTLRAICHMFEAFIFLYLGLGITSFGGKSNYNFTLIFFAILSIMISRTHVFLILPIARILPKEKPIPFAQQVLMWFSGLRGAVAFALGVTFLENPSYSEEIKGVIFGTTVMVIVFTVLVFGGLTPYMLVWLKIVKAEEIEEEMVTSHPNIAASGMHGDGGQKRKKDGYGKLEANHQEGDEDEMEVVQASDMEQPLFGWLFNFDKKYIQSYFTKPEQERIQASHDVLANSIPALTKDPSQLDVRVDGASPITNGTGDITQEKSPFVKTNKAEDIMLETINLN